MGRNSVRRYPETSSLKSEITNLGRDVVSIDGCCCLGTNRVPLDMRIWLTLLAIFVVGDIVSKCLKNKKNSGRFPTVIRGVLTRLWDFFCNR